MKNVDKEVEEFVETIEQLGKENSYTLGVSFANIEKLNVIINNLFIDRG